MFWVKMIGADDDLEEIMNLESDKVAIFIQSHISFQYEGVRWVWVFYLNDTTFKLYNIFAF